MSSSAATSLGEQRETLVGHGQIAARQHVTDAERVRELQPEAAACSSSESRMIALERFEPAGRPHRRLALLGARRQPGADRKDLRASCRARAARRRATNASDLIELGFARSKMSILLTTMTIFLPQSRIASIKARSVSVNGRSADVTNSTKSARGTKSVVSRSCSRMIALVPGVSTMWMSSRRSTGAVTDRMPPARLSTPLVAPYANEVNLRRRRRDAFFEDPLRRAAR